VISFNENKSIWTLETKHTAYVFGHSPTGQITNIYFGTKLLFRDDYIHAVDPGAWAPEYPDRAVNREEFMGWGETKYAEPCLKVQFPQKIRDVRLVFQQYTIKADTLTLLLKDAYFDFYVSLVYTVHEEYDLIVRRVLLENKTTEPIIIEQLLSGSIYLPQAEQYHYSYLAGKWAGETQMQKGVIPGARVRLESRCGTPSHQAQPWVALEPGCPATETQGKVYFCALAYSGNWNIIIEKDCNNLVRVSAGLNTFDFQWYLKPGAALESPALFTGYSASGFGPASRNLHAFQLNELLPVKHRTALRKVLYNSWEARLFGVNEKDQINLARLAAPLGVEIFVMDDGWFGERHSDRAGLGDWSVNKDKFPGGLKTLITEVNQLGMDFGLWVEPEMVNPDSDLYRAHPDWVYHFPHRLRTERRNQLVLNLSKPEVREFIKGFMDRLLTENNIKFIKWDMNRSISEPGIMEVEEVQQKELWHRHVLTFYEIVDYLRTKHPEVIFQSCSGGGGRADLGVLSRFDQVWTSDNTDAFDRLRIQHGFSFIYPAKVMEAWVTSEYNQLNNRILPLQYRFHSAMMGNLGIGDDITCWSPEQMAEAHKLINEYKEIRPVIQHGSQYRIDRIPGNMLAVVYVSKDKRQAVLFVFLHINQFYNSIPRVPVDGLDPDAQYRTRYTGEVMSGRALQEIGLKVSFKHNFDSALIRLEQE